MAASPARAAAVCTAAAARSLTTTAAAAAGATTEAPGAPAEQHGARGTTLFSQQAALYAQHRPDYPPALYDAVLSFAAPNRRQLALDVATGTGQVAAELAQHFERVLAVDSAQAQLDHAARRPNIAYQLAPAERLEGVQSGSMDLLTVAQAFHWFDFPAFLAEARRVLRPDSTLAIWGYGMPFLSNPPGHSHDPEALGLLRQALQEMHTCVLGAHWDSRRWLVDNSYRGLEPSAADFGVVRRLEGLSMHRDVSLAGMLGYVASWSSYTAFRRQQPQEPDPLLAFRQRLLQALRMEEEAAAAPAPLLRLEWPLFGFLAKDPAPLPAA